MDPKIWSNYSAEILKINETPANLMNYSNFLFFYDQNTSNITSRSEKEQKIFLINNYQKEFQKLLLNAFSKYENSGGIIAPFFYAFYNQEKMIFMTPMDNLTVLNEFFL